MQTSLRISAEQNTSVRIADDSPLLSWPPRFAAQVMNKMRNGKDGKTSELRRAGRRWRKPMTQLGKKVWFRKIGEDGASSFASRMPRGIIVGHHDRTGAVLCITKNGCARRKLDETDTERCMGRCELGRLVWHAVANGGRSGTPLPRIVVERAPEVEPRSFHVLSADIEAHGHIGGCGLCSAGIALKGDETTQQRMPRTNQNDH